MAAVLRLIRCRIFFANFLRSNRRTTSAKAALDWDCRSLRSWWANTAARSPQKVKDWQGCRLYCDAAVKNSACAAADHDPDRGRDVIRPAAKGVRILVVEDDNDSREVLQLFLEQVGALVESVPSAKDAMSVFKRPPASLPDIIISDLAMPEEDGYSLIARIRQLPAERGGKIPALALQRLCDDRKQTACDRRGIRSLLHQTF